MNNFFKNRRHKPARPRYGDDGYPVDDIPGNERPSYESDDPGIRLKDAPPSGGESEDTSIPGRPGNKSGTRSLPAPTEESSEEPSSAEQEQTQAIAQSGYGTALDDYDFDSALTDYYDKLAAKLRAYGVTDVPAIEQLYGLFESFLRPSIEAAIREREKRGAYNMAELDADAYARGMGSSSYLSSMKAREMDDVNADVMGLEAKYGASMAEYLYKALTAMQDLEASLAKTYMQYAASGSGSGSHSGSHSSSSSHSSSGGSDESSGGSAWGHNSSGAYFDGQWVEGDFSYLDNPAGYNDYAKYIRSLTPGEVYLLFTSNKREWRMKRWQMQYNLNQFDYNELYDTFFGGVSGGSAGDGSGRGAISWQPLMD